MPTREHQRSRESLTPETARPEPAAPARPLWDGADRAQLLFLQRTAGNAAVTGALARNRKGAPPAPAPPDSAPAGGTEAGEPEAEKERDHLMPKELGWEALISEGVEIAKIPGWNFAQIVAIAGWAHVADTTGRLTSRHRLKGTFRLPRGVYAMDADSTYLVTKDTRLGTEIRIPKENLSPELQKKELLTWTDWLDITPEQAAVSFGGPFLVLVVDIPMASSPGQKGEEPNPYYDQGVPEQGYGSEVVGDGSGRAAPLPQLGAEILGLDNQPVGGTGDYRIRINWNEVSSDLLIGAGAASRLHAYKWELWKLEGVTRAEWGQREHTERAKRRESGEHVSKWSGYKRDSARRWSDVVEHAVQYDEDREAAIREGRKGDQLANELNQALYSVEALTNAGGQIVDTLDALFTPANSDERSVGWVTPGMFVLRCVADVDYKAAEDGRPFRPPSVAAKLINVRDVGTVAQEALDEGEAAVAEKEVELWLQRLMDQADPELEPGALSERAAGMEDELEQMRTQTSGEASEALALVADKALRDYERAKTASSLVKAGVRDRQVDKLKKEYEQRAKLVDFARGRRAELQGGKGGSRAVQRVQGTLASRVTGESYPLMLDVNEPQQDGRGGWACTLADVTTQDGQLYHGTGASAIAAVWAAAQDLANRAKYGAGSLALKLPTQFAGKTLEDNERSRQIPSKPRDWTATKARLEELATVLGVIATVALPGAGVVGALIGAGLAADHLYERYTQGTLRWDASLLTDAISLLGGLTAGAKVVGKLAVIQAEGRTMVVIAAEAQRLGQLADKFDTWVGNPAGILWANLQITEQLLEINRLEREHQITSAGARRQRAKTFTSALNTNIGLFVSPRTVKSAGDGPDAPPKPVSDAPPKPVFDAPPAKPVSDAPAKPVSDAPPKPVSDAPPKPAPDDGPGRELEPADVLPADVLKAKTSETGRIPPGRAGDLIRATGDWKQLKALVDGLPQSKRAAAEERLARSRKDNLDAALAHVAKPPFEAYAFDSGSPGFRSDVDVTIQPKEKRPGFKGKGRPVSDQIANAAEAAQDVMTGLRRRFKGDPGAVADIAVHAYIGEDAVKLASSAERAQAAALEHEVGYGELRRGMSDEQWAALKHQMDHMLVGDAPEARKARDEITAMMRAGEEFKARMDRELAIQQEVVAQRSPDLPTEERVIAARDVIVALKRRELAERFAAKPPDMVAILRLQAEIRWFTPGAYATESAFHQAVKHGQGRKAAGRDSAAQHGRKAPTREDVLADLAVSFAQERGVRIEERRARLAAAADANVGMFLAHAGEGGMVDQAKDAAKYGGRILELLDLAGIGGSTPLATAFNDFRAGKLAGAADPVRMLQVYGRATGADPATTPEALGKLFVAEAAAWMTRSIARLRVIERTAPGAVDVPARAPVGPEGGSEKVDIPDTPPPEADVDPDQVLDAVMGVPDPGAGQGGGVPGAPGAGGGQGGGPPPAILATGSDPRAIAFQARFPKVDPAMDSMDALADLFQRTSSGGRAVAPRPGKYVPSLVRGAAPELKTIISFAARPDVVRIVLIPSTNAQRTPDMVIYARQPDGSVQPSRVEIRTVTGGGVGYQDVGKGGRNVATPDRILAAIRSKMRSRPGRRSQLDVPMTGVPPGGTLVVHLPRGGEHAAQNVNLAMQALQQELLGTPWVHAIEFFLPGTATVRYGRDPNGRYTPSS